MKQNITLSIDKELIKQGKIIAARKDISVSKMMGDMLRGIVDKHNRYEAAKRSALAAIKTGIHLGGRKTWKREDR
ncbi:MAG TPA: DUF6364 family protein [Desulfosarcina sp.]|nr:DUF6364 family protein [Desulfosarcina sp.]